MSTKIDYNLPYRATALLVQQAAPNLPVKEENVEVLFMWEDVVRVEEFNSPIVTSRNRTIIITKYHMGNGLVIEMNFEEMFEIWMNYKKQAKLGIYNQN